MSRSSSRPEWRLAERRDLFWKRSSALLRGEFTERLLVRPRRGTDEGYEKPEDSLAKTSRSSGDENAPKLLSNRGFVGDLTGVTLDGSDRLKQNRAQIQPTARLPMLRPQI